MLKQFIIQISKDEEFFSAVYKRISKNSSEQLIKTKEYKSEIQKNLSIIKKDKTSLTNKVVQIPDLKDVIAITLKLKDLELQESILVEQIQNLDKEIDQLTNQKIHPSELKNIFSEFNKIYDVFPIETKRKINKLLFIEITSFNRKGKDAGEIILNIRADGKLKSNWPKTVNPEKLGSQLRGHWLRKLNSIRTFFMENNKLFTFHNYNFENKYCLLKLCR